jgi:hypothetical protein
MWHLLLDLVRKSRLYLRYVRAACDSDEKTLT